MGASARRGGKMTGEASRTELVHGNCGEGIVFLEKSYALDIANYRDALFRARTWGELRSKVDEERYEETVNAWVESEVDRLEAEGETESGAGLEVSPPNPEDPFDAEEIWGYADGDWPEFAPDVMITWVDKEILREYGRHVDTVLDDGYTVIDPKHEEEVASLLEERGYRCTRDEDAVWNAVWGG